MSRRKKLINNSVIPQYKIEAIARYILPDILAFYESEEDQQEFVGWKRQQKILKTPMGETPKPSNIISVAATENT